MKLSRNDYIFTIVSIILIFILSFLLYENIHYRSQASRNAKSIGTVTYKYHKVKRKFMDRFIWEKIIPATPVYLYDSIMTLEQSDAIIRLKSGVEISLDADTLVEIELIDNQIGLALEQGGLQTRNQSSSFVIKTKDDTKIVIGEGNRSRIFSKNGNTSVSVQQGKAEIIDKNNKSQIIKKNEILQKQKNGTWKKSEFRIHTKYPEDQSAFLLNPNEDSKGITFHSEDIDKEKARYLLISRTSTMENAKSYPLENRTSKKVHLSEGLWYWALSSEKSYILNEKNNVSPIKTLRVQKRNKIKIYQPGNNAVYIQKNGEKTVTFSWEAEKDNPIYQFTLAKDKSFHNIIYSLETTNTSVTIPSLSEGKYYWRLNEKNQFLKNSSSSSNKPMEKAYSFVIKKTGPEDDLNEGNEENNLYENEENEEKRENKPPELTYPVPGSKIYSGETIQLRWRKNPLATHYSITVKTSSGKNILQRTTTKNSMNDILISQNTGSEEKIIQIIIRAKDKNNQTLNQSIRKFPLLILKPPIATSIKVQNND